MALIETRPGPGPSGRFSISRYVNPPLANVPLDSFVFVVKPSRNKNSRHFIELFTPPRTKLDGFQFLTPPTEQMFGVNDGHAKPLYSVSCLSADFPVGQPTRNRAGQRHFEASPRLGRDKINVVTGFYLSIVPTRHLYKQKQILWFS